MYTLLLKLPTETTDNQGDISIVNTKHEHYDLSVSDAGDIYDRYERMGYDISIRFDTKEADDVDPFATAERLTSAGVDYNAALKLKNKGTYDEAKALARVVESHGYDFDVAITLRIKDDSTVNFDRESSWFSTDDAFYTVKPKVKSSEIADLRSVYDGLIALGADATIDIKPKKSVERDFCAELAAYPPGTIVTLTLKDSDGGM